MKLFAIKTENYPTPPAPTPCIHNNVAPIVISERYSENLKHWPSSRQCPGDGQQRHGAGSLDDWGEKRREPRYIGLYGFLITPTQSHFHRNKCLAIHTPQMGWPWRQGKPFRLLCRYSPRLFRATLAGRDWIWTRKGTPADKHCWSWNDFRPFLSPLHFFFLRCAHACGVAEYIPLIYPFLRTCQRKTTTPELSSKRFVSTSAVPLKTTAM